MEKFIKNIWINMERNQRIQTLAGIKISQSIFVALIFIFISTGAMAQSKNCFTDAKPDAFMLCIDSCENEIILDVRPFDELKNKAIQNAIMVPDKSDLDKMMDTLDLDTPILVYCVIGVRSVKVCEILCERGFVNVINLNGGFDKWKKNRFKTVEIKNINND